MCFLLDVSPSIPPHYLGLCRMLSRGNAALDVAGVTGVAEDSWSLPTSGRGLEAITAVLVPG